MDSLISTRRGLLASLWTLVTALTALAFFTALLFTLKERSADQNAYNYNDDDDVEEQEQDAEIAVTSRAIAFAALWTAVLAALLAIYGTVILGWQSPTGQYYTCCSPQVHKTTPMALGSFIGALFMFANLTLVCSVMFGEFEIRDYREGGEEQGREDANGDATSRSSTAFSVMCMFLTLLYLGFAGLTFCFSRSVLEELPASRQDDTALYNNGYIGERFDVRSAGFVAPQPAEARAPTGFVSGTLT